MEGGTKQKTANEQRTNEQEALTVVEQTQQVIEMKESP